MLQFTAHFITPIKHSLIFTFEHHITANWINTWYTFKDLIELLLVSYECHAVVAADGYSSNDDGNSSSSGRNVSIHIQHAYVLIPKIISL